MPKIRLEGTIQEKIERVSRLYRQKDADLFSAEAAMINLRANIDVSEVMCRDFGPEEYKPLGYIPDEPDTRPGEITWVENNPMTASEIMLREQQGRAVARALADEARLRMAEQMMSPPVLRAYDNSTEWSLPGESIVERMHKALNHATAPLRNVEQDLKAEKERAEHEEELRKAQGIRPVRTFNFDDEGSK